jgi:hypothetical protein
MEYRRGKGRKADSHEPFALFDLLDLGRVGAEVVLAQESRRFAEDYKIL